MMLALLVLQAALAPGASDALPIRSVLAVEALGERGRSPVHTDALEALLVRGRWVAPSEGEGIRSASGEERVWTRYEADDEGWFRASPFRGGWAWTTVEVPESGAWRLDAIGHSFVLVDGEPRAGDAYQLGITRAPLWLAQGQHELLFQCGRGALRATLERAPATVYLEEKDPTLPDVLRGEDGPLLAGLIVANAGAQAARGLVLVATVEGAEPTRTALPPLAASSYRKCRVELRAPAAPEAETLAVRLELLDAEGTLLHAATLELRVRDLDDVHVRTFESAIDGSVQEFALRPPAPRGPGGPDDPGGPLDLILSLHGAGVDARRQASAYRARPGVLVVAPTNRRPFGFDWEDWGRLDALEVLAQAEALYDTNPRRTYLTGHSMGGHGTWQLGVHFPDRFAAIAPSAGWRDFWHYTGSEPLDDADPVGRLLNGAANASRTLLLKHNLLQSGVYVLHGDADETVPVAEARAMRGVLAEGHPDFAYYERKGAGHWWGDECMDWPPLVDFLRAHELGDPRAVLEVDFTTVDPGVSHRCQWVDVRWQEDALEPSRVIARLDPQARTITVEATNVGLLGLHLAPLSEARDAEPAILEAGRPVLLRLNGWEVELPFQAPIRPVYLVHGPDGTWSDLYRGSSDFTGSDVPAFERGRGLKAAFRHRMVFVYGTQGTPEENAWARAKARFDHETWRYRGNGALDVLADVDFDPARDPDRGVVLYGNRATNAAWEALLAAGDRPAPFELGRGRLSLAGRTLEGDDLALLAVHPRQGSDHASVAVVGGTGLSGMRTTDHLPLFVSGVAWPSWTVIGAELASEGLAAVRGAGWSWLADFQPAWR